MEKEEGSKLWVNQKFAGELNENYPSYFFPAANSFATRDLNLFSDNFILLFFSDNDFWKFFILPFLFLIIRSTSPGQGLPIFEREETL